MSRPLLPIPGQSSASTSGFGESGGPFNSPPKPPNPPNSNPKSTSFAKRGKITIVACVPCRRRKTKCDGRRPTCSQCQAREGLCHYDMTDQERRLTYLRDNVEHLAEEKAILESLVTTLQIGSEADVAEIMRRLRAGDDVHALAQQVHAVQLLAGVRGKQNPSGESSVAGAVSSQLSQAAPSSRLLNKYETLVQTISLGTTAEADEIVRRLRAREDVVSLFNAVRSDRLLQAMQNRGNDTPPSIEAEFSRGEQTFGLVKGSIRHAAEASSSMGRHASVSLLPASGKQLWTTVSDDDDFIEHVIALYFSWLHPFFQSFPEQAFREDMAAGRTQFCSRSLLNAVCATGCMLSQRADARQKEAEFFEEAAYLLKSTNVPSVTSIAATYLLSHVEGARGRLHGFWSYSGQSGRMALDVNLHLRSERSFGTETDAKAGSKSRSHTFWGCFIADQVVSFTLGRLPQLQTNAITLDLPSVDPEEDLAPWAPYAAEQPSDASIPSARSTTFRELAALSKIVNSTLQMFFAPTKIISGGLYLDEYQKYTDWHERLPANVTVGGSASPHVLCLHMYYQAATLLLFRPLLRAQFTSSSVDPRDVCRKSASAISELFAQHKRLYGFNGVHTFQLNCLLTACSIHVINLPAVAASRHLTDACNIFHDLIHVNAWATGSLNVIKDLVTKWQLILPMEVEEALHRNGDVPLSDFNLNLSPSTSSADVNNIAQEASDSLKRPSTDLILQEGQKRQRTASKEKLEMTNTYLFAPFPNQPAPLLGPMHTSTSADTEWNDELNKMAQEFDGLDFSADPYVSFSWPKGFDSEQEGTWE